MKGKKGIAAQVILALGGLLIAGILIVLYFMSTHVRWIISGIGVFIAGVYVLISIKDVRVKVFLTIVLFGAGIFMTFGSGIIQSYYGYTSLSISNVEVIDDGARIRIFGVATGAENINILFNADDITNYVKDDGYAATKSVSGIIRLTKQLKRFLITKQTDEPFKSISSKAIGVVLSCSSTNCANVAPSGYVHNDIRFRSTFFNCVCLYEKGEGINSIFSGRAISDSIVEFNIGGAIGVLRPALGYNTITLNDGRTKVEWTGALSNYDQIFPPNYAVLFKESAYDRLISPNAYSNYKDSLNEFGNCVGTPNFYLLFLNPFGLPLFSGPSVSKITSCTASFNNQLDTILASKTALYEESIDAKQIGFGLNSLDVDLKTPSQFPTFIITLDASKVGIVELRGKPYIVNCVPNIDMKSGDTVPKSISVRNVGEADGSFYGQVSCDKPTASGIMGERLVDAGGTADIPVQITGVNKEGGTLSTTCTYKVIDRKSERSASCSSKVNVAYQENIVCDPNTDKCVDDVTLRRCSLTGEFYEDIKCDFDCIVENGLGRCGKKGEPILECRWYENYIIEKDCGLLNWREWTPFVSCVETSGCKTAGWVWASLIGGSILVIGFVILLIPIKNKKKGRSKR